jgi:hypothetical protein
MRQRSLLSKMGLLRAIAIQRSIKIDTILIFLVLLFILICFVYGRLHLYAFGELGSVVTRIPDDTGYFYKIARNVVLGKGLTFDGINKTNGFQPLWLYLLLPVAWITRHLSVDTYLRVALIYQLILVALAGIIFYLVVAMYHRRGIALAATALFYLLGANWFANGMETGILILCLVTLLYFSIKYQLFSNEYQPKKAFIFGLLFGLTILARLDMIILLIVVYIYLIIWLFNSSDNLNRNLKINQIFITSIAICLIVLPYFIYNQIRFGSIMPISGQLKNSFPYIVQADFSTNRFPLQVIYGLSIIIIYFIFNIFFTIRSFKIKDPLSQYWITIMFIGALTIFFHYLNTALFMKWAVFSWHFSFYFIYICLVFSDILKLISSHISLAASRWVLNFILIMLIGGLMIRSYRIATTPPLGWHVQAYRAALWARAHTEPQSIFAMKDAGLFGLLSDRTVINLDGLVNNIEYQKYLMKKELNKYFNKNNIEYLVQHAIWESETPEYKAVLESSYDWLDLRFRSRLYNTMSDPIRVYRQDEVYRSERYYDGRYWTVFIIWKLR